MLASNDERCDQQRDPIVTTARLESELPRVATLARRRLWFNDFYAHAVKSVSPTGDLRTEFAIDDQPSGLGWLPDGAQLIVSMRKRCVLVRRASGIIQ